MNSKLTKLTIFFQNKKEKKFIDFLIKNYSIPSSVYTFFKDGVVVTKFDSYSLTDIRNDCAQISVSYIDEYE